MKTEMTPRQAMTLYSTIEALMNQFDAENDPAGKGDCWSCNERDSVVAYRCSKCHFLGTPKQKTP